MTNKEKKVYNLLLTPIKSDKKCSKIELKDGVIRTPQRYQGALDEDMSDLSIGFYQIVYEDILKGNAGALLSIDGKYMNNKYLGDTMHSFNSLANIILGDSSKHERSPEDKWPPELVDYRDKYHCLANFWVIPMNHGRRSVKLNRYDSMDCYLSRVKKDFIHRQCEYFVNFPDFNSFLEIHCISNYEINEQPLEMYKDRDCCLKELRRVRYSWESRAEKLVQKHGDRLYTYFSKELSLI